GRLKLSPSPGLRANAALTFLGCLRSGFIFRSSHQCVLVDGLRVIHFFNSL
ncbi:hypothetical protein G4B88_010588, partial [Cannabis sativa]